jgi:hypothetical protein
MTTITAQHKTAKDKDGNPLRAEFDEISWITKWQNTGEWLFISRNSTNELFLAPAAVEAPKLTIKKSCCGKK